ncbi:hypothetical protein A4H02_02135 [Fervidobacterium thailandense]|uniref:Uncharacterized protein n=2 Tax=Fervidobacterium thailandense TaxID=1008305 RepID=A0A1E3G4I2_9BACT|nr:hypothetical protein A4H02_02135 [Fervidobacterium thailandense]
MFLNFSLTIFSIFYMVGFIGNAMYGLARNEETEYLLTLPIDRRSLALYNILVSTNSQFYTLAFLLGAILGYTVGLGLNIPIQVLKVLLHVYFLTSLSSLIALLLGGMVSKEFVRKLNVLLTLALIFFYFGVSYLYDAQFSGLKVRDANIERFARWFLFVNTDYNFLSWTFSSKTTLLLGSVLISILASIAFFLLSPKLAFEPVVRKGVQHFKDLTMDLAKIAKNRRPRTRGSNAVFWKDWKLLQRNEQFLFLILYPLGFGIFMVLVSAGSARYLSLPFIGVSVFYCAIEAGILLSRETSQKDFALTLPVRLSSLFFPKLFIPVLLNVGLFFVILMFSYALNRLDKFVLILAPIHLLLLTLSSLVGAYFSLKRPGKGKNQPFDAVAVFIVQGITFGLAISMLMPASVLTYAKGLSPLEILIHRTILFSGIVSSLVLLVLFARKLAKLISGIK